MKSEIISKEKNLFLEREEVVLGIESLTPPSYHDVKKIIGGDESLIVIRKLNNSFGKHRFIAELDVYNSKENLDKVIMIPKKIRKKIEKEKKNADEIKKKAEEEAKVAKGVEDMSEGSGEGKVDMGSQEESSNESVANVQNEGGGNTKVRNENEGVNVEEVKE